MKFWWKRNKNIYHTNWECSILIRQFIYQSMKTVKRTLNILMDLDFFFIVIRQTRFFELPSPSDNFKLALPVRILSKNIPWTIFHDTIFRFWYMLYTHSNMTPFFRFVNKRASYPFDNLISTCAGECDLLFHWQHKLCATFSANVNINYRLPINVYYRICTLRHIRIEINHGSQNVFWVLTWVGGY